MFYLHLPSLLSNGYLWSFPQGMKLITLLHLVPRFKNAWSCASTPPYVVMALCLVKHRDDFTFHICINELCKSVCPLYHEHKLTYSRETPREFRAAGDLLHLGSL